MSDSVRRATAKWASRSTLAMASAAAWALAGAAPQQAWAVDSNWTPTTGGTFSDGNNWSTTPNPPGAADVAIFNNSLTGTVSFTGPVTNTSLALRANTGGVVTLDLNGFTYTVS